MAPSDVLEAGVLGRGIDPPGGLQLVDLPQPLHPGVVDDPLLGDFALGQPRRRGEGDIAVDGVVAQAFVGEVGHGSYYARAGRAASRMCVDAAFCRVVTAPVSPIRILLRSTSQVAAQTSLL